MLHACNHRRFRACGRDQRAFRSPFGNLRPPYLMQLLQVRGPEVSFFCICMKKARFFISQQGNEASGSLICKMYGAEGVQGAIGKPPGAPAGAKSLCLDYILCQRSKIAKRPFDSIHLDEIESHGAAKGLSLHFAFSIVAASRRSFRLRKAAQPRDWLSAPCAVNQSAAGGSPFPVGKAPFRAVMPAFPFGNLRLYTL